LAICKNDYLARSPRSSRSWWCSRRSSGRVSTPSRGSASTPM
jgi:hypothetical protein